jgi:cysteine-rich repeat protein
MRHLVPAVLLPAFLILAGCGGDDGGGGPDAYVCVVVTDNNECTEDVCTNNVLQHNPTPGEPCATGTCNAEGTCVAASCTDGFENGSETDVDCGGSCAPTRTCADGRGCGVPGDCASGVCSNMICQAPRCGDGVMHAGEMCDDGNDTNGDGCDDGAADACRATGCGNGVVTGAEVCDDGNANNGDGCDNNCTVSACGNGVTAGAETCDDGDAMGGDGCSATCMTEPGYTCTMAVPSVCTTTCGDGVRAGTEACDDGDMMGGDGCSATCTVEAGFTCMGSPLSTCTPTCGDGMVVMGEGCDDAPPAENGDGCSATCTVEPGYTCMGSPSTCTRPCGNGMLDMGEECDDGNTVGGDGCGTTCLLDLGCPAGQQQRVVTTTPALAIPDNDPAGASSTAMIVGAGAVTRAVFYLGGLTHTYDGDLQLALVSPGGRRRDLSLNRGVSGDDFRRTFFDDAATGPISAGTAPFTGRFRPEQTLSTTAGADLRGLGAAGTWTFRVVDTAAIDTGTIDSWSLLLCVDPAAPFCGDGIRNGGEECDDGNTVDNDACTNLCAVTSGCGDGRLDAGEQCDDDNLTAGDGCSATCTVDITCPAGQTPVVLANAAAQAIPDNGAAITSPVTVAAAGAITRVTAVISVAHTADADLDIALVNPRGIARELSTDNGGTGDNYAGTAFDDEATTAITLGTAPFTGRFRPEQSLSTTAGADFLRTGAAGPWNLRIADDAATETGMLTRWTLTACVDPAATYCGDGIMNGGEECDDGNAIEADGCDNLCRVRGCGDGILDAGEACDDDNLTAGDGCSPTCQPDIACAAGETAVIVAHPMGEAIPDTVGGLVSTVNVPNAGLVRKVIATVNASHANLTQLDLFLQSPRGIQRYLARAHPGTGYRATIFSDTAARTLVNGASPYTGAFQPDQTIANPAGFADQQAAGGWIVRASDAVPGTTGTLDSWTLAVCVDAAAGASRCGNGVVEAGETCDDSGTMAGDGCSATCQVELGCAAGQTAVVVSATDLPLLIPDNLPAGVSSTLAVAAGGNVMKAVVVVGTLTHTFDGDLDLTLVSPTGTMIDLSSGNGGGGDDFVSTIFADAATTAITAGVPPMRGSFRPEAVLAGVNGQAAAGNWTFKVVDHAGADAGMIVSWTLGLCVQ